MSCLLSGGTILVFALGVVLGLAAAALSIGLWWTSDPRFQRAVPGFAIRALGDGLARLQSELPARGAHADQAQRCTELCATVQRLINE